MATRGSPRESDNDDWFAETDFAPRGPRRPVTGENEALATFDVAQAADDWLARNAPRDEVIPGVSRVDPRDPRLWAGLAAVVALVVIGLFVGGVFSSSDKTPPATTPVTQTPTTTAKNGTTAKPAKTQSKVVLPTLALKPGDAGTQVTRLQRTLTALGYAPGKVDGRFGPATKVALQKFQKAKKLTADGIMGPKTLRALVAAYAAKTAAG
jgi:Putative peptidoglycan binding domain